ncbi:MAG: hypothetical protein HWE18_10245 [Gammaproteobacteria bacterium]|nr:hypothetical protein [Gammaproteobacteria bacterium]
MGQKYRLGELLTRCGAITLNQLDEALIYQQQYKILIGEALIRLGFLTSKQLKFALMKQHGLRYLAALTASLMAPFCYGQNTQQDLEQLPQYSYTQVAQNPCPFQAIYSHYNDPSAQQSYDVIEAATAALWYVSQGGVNKEGLAHVPVQVHLTTEDFEDGISLNFSVKF